MLLQSSSSSSSRPRRAFRRLSLPVDAGVPGPRVMLLAMRFAPAARRPGAARPACMLPNISASTSSSSSSSSFSLPSAALPAPATAKLSAEAAAVLLLTLPMRRRRLAAPALPCRERGDKDGREFCMVPAFCILPAMSASTSSSSSSSSSAPAAGAGAAPRRRLKLLMPALPCKARGDEDDPTFFMLPAINASTSSSSSSSAAGAILATPVPLVSPARSRRVSAACCGCEPKDGEANCNFCMSFVMRASTSSSSRSSSKPAVPCGACGSIVSAIKASTSTPSYASESKSSPRSASPSASIASPSSLPSSSEAASRRSNGEVVGIWPLALFPIPASASAVASSFTSERCSLTSLASSPWTL
mmetsp:Transcript_164182/g.290725  ORF Transcript_164182/g.290725 Transcript_164182/m.290725 type:complete len:360 (-) Transcript_164182:32-1111(-)